MNHHKVIMWAGVVVGSALSLMIGLSEPSHATTAPASSTITLQIPAACLSSTATHRTYPLNLPAADTYARSSEHGHGKLTCVVFMTRSYSKVLVIDQAAGGYVIGPDGVDVTYVDCGLPGYSFPPNNLNNARYDCGEAWGTSEDNWTIPAGYPFAGQIMHPGSTP